jgi:hypothetical protein
LLIVTVLGHGPSLVHGHVVRGGCSGNIPKNGTFAGCAYHPLAHQRVEFQSLAGVTLAATTTASDGSYLVVLLGGHYHVVAPGLTGVDMSQLDLIEWWNQHVEICLCMQAG